MVVIMKTILKTIPLSSILLDDENPRLAFTKIEKEVQTWTPDDMTEEIKETYAFNNLLHSIQEHGIMDPIWVQNLGNEKYKVVEGNMRVTALNELVSNNVSSPSGIDYKNVIAHVIEKDVSKRDIDAQKAVLQTGKNPWGAFNEASHIYDLFWRHNATIDEIARMLGKSVPMISQKIDNFKIYKEFIEFLRKNGLVIDPNKYSFVADATNAVRIKFFQTPQSREEYFKLITPNEKGTTRITSVSNRGGLKTFSKFVNDAKTLNYFLKNPTVSVDDAFEFYNDQSSPKKKTFVKKIPSITRAMHKLNKFDRKEIMGNSSSKAELLKLMQEIKKFFD